MRFTRKTGLIFCLLLFFYTAGATSVHITAPEYAGDAFTFYVVPNFLTDKQEVIGEGSFNDKGELTIELDIHTIMPVFSEFDVYKGWFIVVPGENYEIILPPKEVNNSSNPYFRPKLVHFGLKNADPKSTNMLIDYFNRIYGMELSKNMNQIFYRRSLETAEQVIADLQTRFEKTDDKYFEDYKNYKYASLKYMALIQDPRPIMEEYFIDHEILYHHPQYSELFDKLYAKYLQYATQDVDGHKISVLINSGAYEQLIEWLVGDKLINKALAEAIILKGMKTLFYSKRFNTVGLFNLLQRITETSEVEIHKTTANKIFNELARTMYGAAAPELSLVDINGNFVSWDDFEGKYVYLCFTRSDNEKFAPHKELMKDLYLKYHDDLELVVIIEDDEIEKNAELLKADGFNWTVLRGMTRRDIYDSYNVRILPTYFLIDPQGRMAGQQAPWPDENFEMQFANILKATRN
ncbi:MAG: TlpA family protein disulfide reductase [Prolixibacteraceae bacterium]|nr:TlpA family protein disulfide reductase [Prolixibacteraceae bacterium]